MLVARNIHKSFDGQSVLRGVTLGAGEGEIVALLGPSGCGKTTLLRIVAGLETADQGELLLNEADLTEIPVHKRGFGMVFQDYALFPHKNVKQNVAFGLRMLDWKDDQVEDRVQQVLGLVGLVHLGGRGVHELSGGEQQRVALARALAPFPRVLLLDEPLGSLDRALRERLMGELRTILKRAAMSDGRLPAAQMGAESSDISTHGGMVPDKKALTSIYVTHDQEEAFAIADRIMVMNEGQIEQTGTPMGLYRQPKTVFVARFLGMENLFEAEIVKEDPPEIRCSLGTLRIGEAGDVKPGRATLLIRPEAASLASPDEEGINILEVKLVEISFRGQHQVVIVEPATGAGASPLKFNFESTERLPATASLIRLRLDAEQMLLLKS